MRLQKHSILTVTALTTSALLSASHPVSAQCPPMISAQQARLRSPIPGTDDYLGFAVDIDGDTAIVGAYYDNLPNKTDAGSARVFVRSGVDWQEIPQGLLTASDAQANDVFGYSVAIDGDVIVIGAHGDDSHGSASGHAYVFELQGEVWVETAILDDPSGAAGDYFGFDVDVCDDTIVVGARSYDAPSFVDSGAAFVFVRSGSSWSLQQQLMPSTPQYDQRFGHSVAIDGDDIVVGAPLDNLGGADRGSAYVFARSGSTWTEVQKLAHPGGANGDELGCSVAIDGDLIVAGAVFDDNIATDQGSALVFSRQYGVWAYEAVLTAANGAASDYFGVCVDVEGEVVLVGSQRTDVSGSASGSAYAFRCCSPGAWQEMTQILAWDGSGSDYFGQSVALSGGTAVIGSPYFDSTATNEGAAYICTLSTGRFRLYGFGDGSGTPCPCANDSLPGMGQGCRNSTGFGANLSAWGSDSVGADDLTLVAGNLLPSTPALLFAGQLAVNAGQGLTFGDGLRVAGGGIVRLGVKVPTVEGFTTWGPALQAAGGWSAHTTKHFQVWYRDPVNSPCGTNQNLSNALEVTFTP